MCVPGVWCDVCVYSVICVSAYTGDKKRGGKQDTVIVTIVYSLCFMSENFCAGNFCVTKFLRFDNLAKLKLL